MNKLNINSAHFWKTTITSHALPAKAIVFMLVYLMPLVYISAASGQTLPQASPKPYWNFLATSCSLDTIRAILSLTDKRDGEVKSADSAAIVKDGREVIQLANGCLLNLPENCETDTCNDAKIFLKWEILFAQGDLGSNLNSNAELTSSLREELYGAVELCRNASILKSGHPYDNARLTIKGAITVAARIYQHPGSPVEEYVQDLRECSQRIGADVSF